LDGDWQSYKYFENYVNTIRKDFTLKDPLPENISALGKTISSERSVCMHVRRGDYVGNPFYAQLGKEYYENALHNIQEKVAIDRVYIFSDNPTWCRENLHFSMPVEYVGKEYVGEQDTGHFWLMQQCHHFIIANSSFSWWAAWLKSGDDKIVVAPRNWFANPDMSTEDLIPPDWIQV